MLTSGISAEYGRFSGGVVNLVTKRGGNRFSGSFRTTSRNPSWTDETPFETTARRDDLQQVHEGTLGGPDPARQGVVLRAPAAGRRPRRRYNFRITQVPGVGGRRRPAHRRQGHRDAVRQPHVPGQLRRQRHAADRRPRHQRLGHRSARALHAAASAEAGGRQLERRADVASCSPRRSGRRRSSRSRTTAAAARPCATRRSARSAATAFRRACCTTRRTSTSTIPRTATTSS